jgi:hypothetical protein
MFVCNNDLRFLVSPVLMIVFCVSEKSSNLGAGKLFHNSSLIQIFIIASLFAISLIVYLLIKRKSLNTSNLLKSRMFYAFIVFSVGIALNGLFVKEAFSFSNFLYTLAIIGSLLGIFVAFYVTIDFSKDFKKYLVFVLYIASLVVLLEFITFSLCACDNSGKPYAQSSLVRCAVEVSKSTVFVFSVKATASIEAASGKHKKAMSAWFKACFLAFISLRFSSVNFISVISFLFSSLSAILRPVVPALPSMNTFFI